MELYRDHSRFNVVVILPCNVRVNEDQRKYEWTLLDIIKDNEIKIMK